MDTQIITTGQHGQPITPFAQAEVAGVTIRASHGWKSPGIRIRASHKDLIPVEEIPALVEALQNIMAAAPEPEAPAAETKAPASANLIAETVQRLEAAGSSPEVIAAVVAAMG